MLKPDFKNLFNEIRMEIKKIQEKNKAANSSFNEKIIDNIEKEIRKELISIDKIIKHVQHLNQFAEDEATKSAFKELILFLEKKKTESLSPEEIDLEEELEELEELEEEVEELELEEVEELEKEEQEEEEEAPLASVTGISIQAILDALQKPLEQAKYGVDNLSSDKLTLNLKLDGGTNINLKQQDDGKISFSGSNVDTNDFDNIAKIALISANENTVFNIHNGPHKDAIQAALARQILAKFKDNLDKAPKIKVGETLLTLDKIQNLTKESQDEIPQEPLVEVREQSREEDIPPPPPEEDDEIPPPPAEDEIPPPPEEGFPPPPPAVDVPSAPPPKPRAGILKKSTAPAAKKKSVHFEDSGSPGERERTPPAPPKDPLGVKPPQPPPSISDAPPLAREAPPISAEPGVPAAPSIPEPPAGSAPNILNTTKPKPKKPDQERSEKPKEQTDLKAQIGAAKEKLRKVVPSSQSPNPNKPSSASGSWLGRIQIPSEILQQPTKKISKDEISKEGDDSWAEDAAAERAAASVQPKPEPAEKTAPPQSQPRLQSNDKPSKGVEQTQPINKPEYPVQTQPVSLAAALKTSLDKYREFVKDEETEDEEYDENFGPEKNENEQARAAVLGAPSKTLSFDSRSKDVGKTLDKNKEKSQGVQNQEVQNKNRNKL